MMMDLYFSLTGLFFCSNTLRINLFFFWLIIYSKSYQLILIFVLVVQDTYLLKYVLHFRVIYPGFCQDRNKFFAVAGRSMAEADVILLHLMPWSLPSGEKGFPVSVSLL